MSRVRSTGCAASPHSSNFFTAFSISHGDRNCPFLTLTTLPGLCAQRSSKSVCRQRNAGICRISTTFRRLRRLLFRMHVGQHRHAKLILHLLQDRQALFQPRPAKGHNRRPIGLIEGRFEDIGHAERSGISAIRSRRVHDELLALDHTGPRDQKRPIPRPTLNGPSSTSYAIVSDSTRFSRDAQTDFQQGRRRDKTGGVAFGLR